MIENLSLELFELWQFQKLLSPLWISIFFLSWIFWIGTAIKEKRYKDYADNKLINFVLFMFVTFCAAIFTIFVLWIFRSLWVLTQIFNLPVA
tara:strand:+ start:215 stop:490 length:276 start_codon:yes stop_codon:yes gene_type:complete